MRVNLGWETALLTTAIGTSVYFQSMVVYLGWIVLFFAIWRISARNAQKIIDHKDSLLHADAEAMAATNETIRVYSEILRRKTTEN